MRGAGRGSEETEMDGVSSVRGYTGGGEWSRRCTEEIRGKAAFGEMTSQEVGKGGDNEHKARSVCLGVFVDGKVGREA